MPLSNILFYLHALVVVLLGWWEPLKAMYHHTRLEGDRSLLGLIQHYIYLPAGVAVPYFLAAYGNTATQKRICYIGSTGGSLIMLSIAYRDWLRGKEEWQRKHEIHIEDGIQLVSTAVLLLLDGLVLVCVVEGEEWLKRRQTRKMVEEENARVNLEEKRKSEVKELEGKLD